MARLVAMTLALLLSCCTGGTTRRSPPATGGDCEAVRPRVESLYRAQLAAASRDPDDASSHEPDDGASVRQQAQITDDTAMILTDCRTDPQRFVPCIKAATSAAQLEQECVVPLDDQGNVEARTFGRGQP